MKLLLLRCISPFPAPIGGSRQCGMMPANNTVDQRSTAPQVLRAAPRPGHEPTCWESNVRSGTQALVKPRQSPIRSHTAQATQAVPAKSTASGDTKSNDGLAFGGHVVTA